MDFVFSAYCVLRTAYFLRPYLARLYAILSPNDPISARSGFGRTQGSPLRWILSFLRTVHCGLRTSYALISPVFMRSCLRMILSRRVRDSGEHKVRPYDGFCLFCVLCTADCVLLAPYLARLYAILSPNDPIPARSGFGRTQGSPLRWILSFLRTVHCGLRTSCALSRPPLCDPVSE
jgi:hypothetical protein